MTTIATNSSPIVNTKVSVALTDGIGTLVEWEVISVPSQSSYEPGKMVDEAGNDVDYFVPDVSGTWGVRANEFNVVRGRGNFLNSPKGADTKTFLATGTTTIEVGELLDVPIFTDVGDGGVLHLTIAGYSVLDAEISDFANAKSETAAITSSVQTALTNIVGVSISQAGWDIVQRTNAICTAYRAHAEALSSHSFAASSGSTGTNLGNTYLFNNPPENLDDAVVALNLLKSKLTQHQRPSVEVTTWHITDDVASKPKARVAKDGPSAVTLMASLADSLSDHIITGTDSFVTSTAFASGGTSYPLTGAINNDVHVPRRVYFFKSGGGTIGAAALASVVGVDWRGNAVTDSMSFNSGGSVYFKQVTDISTRTDNSSSGTIYLRFGTYGQVHDKADTANALAAPKYIDTIITSYLDALETFYPVPASTTNVGVVEASHRLGLKRKG